MVKTLRVNEIFCSIQGESTHAGKRCAFIRLNGCNLSCSWCDTRYALDESGRELSLDMIIEAVRPYKVDLVEITGGEPLIQAATPELAMRLAQEGYEVLVETNGSMDISLLPYPIKRIMDLKGPSSGEMDNNRLENLLYLRHGDEVKFVIADSNDYEWAKVTISGGDYPADKVATLFSPVQGRLEAAELVEWIMKDHLPVRLNLQVHKYIWPGIERGV